MGDVDYVNFDAGRSERNKVGFEIGGEKFAVFGAHPEDVYALKAEDTASSMSELLDYYQRFVEAFVYPDDRPRWKQLVARREDALTFGDYEALAVWLSEREKQRPTMPSAPSGGTDGRASTGSRGGRSRPQVVVPGSS